MAIKTNGILIDEKQTILQRRSKQSFAYLEPLPHIGQMPGGGILQLPAKEIRFGSDATRCSYVLEDVSVDALHAILFRNEDTFTIQDQGSIAGTWVNYEMLTGEDARRLKHGDIIHFGQLAYRFQLRIPPERSGPQIAPDKSRS